MFQIIYSLHVLIFAEAPPEDLDVRFSRNTPRVVGNRIEFQVLTNKPANVRCRVSGGVGTIACK